ncbi:hypothetical protein SESBI_38941 [Sesbania bispinosa]|nr:hypothetical protein SESBI_38941 [Sesbania bispinosa]
MAEFFHNIIDEVAALPTIKKDFEMVNENLKADEVKMTKALGMVKTLSDENIRLEESNTKLAEEVSRLKMALAEKQSEAIQVVLEKQKIVKDAHKDKEIWQKKVEWYEAYIEWVEDLWEESAECFFHIAIEQIKFLNPDIELQTKVFVEEMPGNEEINPPPIKPIMLKEDVEREEKEGPIESKMVDLVLDGTKP